MREITFHNKFVRPILDESEWWTFRYGDKYEDVSPGEVLLAVTPEGQPISFIEVTHTEEITCQEIVDKTWFGHDDYRYIDELYGELEEYYPDVHFGALTKMTAIQFRRLG